MPEIGTQPDTPLSDIRVVELADEQAEYCGRVLSGLGADVIKVEPPQGNPTRRIGPFYQDREDPEGSLYFWHYNLGKKSAVIDIEAEPGKQRFLDLLATADVFLESTQRGYLEKLGLGRETLQQRYPNLIIARVSPFGDEGPWADYKGSDLVHLALGGPMMFTGYAPRPDGTYDLPPIAPQAWHAYHIAGELLLIGVLGALLHRRETGEGQYVTCPVHQAVACNTSPDLLRWVFNRSKLSRAPFAQLAPSKDGRLFLASPPTVGVKTNWNKFVDFMDGHKSAADLRDVRYQVMGDRSVPTDAEMSAHVREAIARLVGKYTAADVPWREAQENGFLWGPVRHAHENAFDEHWRKRGTIADVEHEDLGQTFPYPVAKWASDATAWRTGPRAPHIGEHTDEVMAELPRRAVRLEVRPTQDERRSRSGKPFALHGVRILDFTWWLASGGAPRYLSALGAENIKVEWKGAPDLRTGAFWGHLPVGGREARMNATGPVPPDLSTNNHNGEFNDWHAGQRGISLNVRNPKGLEIARRLIAASDIVVEGFSPGVMASWDLGYDVMKELKPDIIYAQQSGFGQGGIYGKYRSFDMLSAAMAGVLEMAGLPEPAPPVGWGYVFMDWFGAFNLAAAMLTALNYKARTGKGQWIDSAHAEGGIFLNGVTMLDWAANGREWHRAGNRSPHKAAAPHGAYRCEGVDRWVTIACFTETEWEALCTVAAHPEWRSDPRFRTLKDRIANQDALDAAIEEWTSKQERYTLMHRLQGAGIAAGVCQDAEDRCENDPQLAALNWLTELEQTEMGHWPVREVPVKMSETPPFMGGDIDRGAPCYGEDNEYVFGELLGMSSQQIHDLAEEGII